VAAELKVKEQARTAATSSLSSSSKRKAGEEGEEGGEEEGDEGLEGVVEVERETTTTTEDSRREKRERTEEREIVADGTASASRSFPANFFSDPARKPPPTITGDEEDQEDQDRVDQDGEGGNNKTTAAADAPNPQFAMEWDAFERDMQNLQQQKQDDGATANPQEMYARATIAAEPELVPKFIGLPEGAGAGALEGQEAEGGLDAVRGEEVRKVSSEEEERRNKEREERELIIDRLMEEERAQEDAYNRVALLRNRVQMLKQKRELAKTKGKGKKTDTEG